MTSEFTPPAQRSAAFLGICQWQQQGPENQRGLDGANEQSDGEFGTYFGVYLFGAYCREHGTAMINRSNWAENMVSLHTSAIFKMTLVTLVTSVGDMMF